MLLLRPSLASFESYVQGILSFCQLFHCPMLSSISHITLGVISSPILTTCVNHLSCCSLYHVFQNHFSHLDYLTISLSILFILVIHLILKTLSFHMLIFALLNNNLSTPNIHMNLPYIHIPELTHIFISFSLATSFLFKNRIYNILYNDVLIQFDF